MLEIEPLSEHAKYTNTIIGSINCPGCGQNIFVEVKEAGDDPSESGWIIYHCPRGSSEGCTYSNRLIKDVEDHKKH